MTLNRSFKCRYNTWESWTKRRLKDRFTQHRRIEKFSLYLKKAGFASRNIVRKLRPYVSKKNCLLFNENFPADKPYRLLESI